TLASNFISLSYAGQVGVFTFLFQNGILPDADYRARIIDSGVSDLAGNQLAAHAGIEFFSLMGDLNRDRQVTIADFITLASNFGKSETIWSEGDLNGAGVVSIGDLIDLSANFNKTLGTAQVAASGAVSSISRTLAPSGEQKHLRKAHHHRPKLMRTHF